jgi:hypothetical protein
MKRKDTTLIQTSSSSKAKKHVKWSDQKESKPQTVTEQQTGPIPLSSQALIAALLPKPPRRIPLEHLWPLFEQLYGVGPTNVVAFPVRLPDGGALLTWPTPATCHLFPHLTLHPEYKTTSTPPASVVCEVDVPQWMKVLHNFPNPCAYEPFQYWDVHPVNTNNNSETKNDSAPIPTTPTVTPTSDASTTNINTPGWKYSVIPLTGVQLARAVVDFHWHTRCIFMLTFHIPRGILLYIQDMYQWVLGLEYAFPQFKRHPLIMELRRTLIHCLTRHRGAVPPPATFAFFLH